VQALQDKGWYKSDKQPGLTQLAKAMDPGKPLSMLAYLSRLRTADNDLVVVERLAMIAAQLDISLGWLITGVEAKNPTAEELSRLRSLVEELIAMQPEKAESPSEVPPSDTVSRPRARRVSSR
jgi:hypothetical protein